MSWKLKDGAKNSKRLVDVEAFDAFERGAPAGTSVDPQGVSALRAELVGVIARLAALEKRVAELEDENRKLRQK